MVKVGEFPEEMGRFHRERLDVPEMPIFRTVDSVQRIRMVYAFYCCGLLYEFDTRQQAETARDRLLVKAREG